MKQHFALPEVLKKKLPSNKTLKTGAYRSYLLFFITVGLVLSGIYYNSLRLGYSWHWHRVPRYLILFHDHGFSAGLLIQGLAVTFKISILASLLALFFGLATALMKLSGSIAGKAIAGFYIETTRNTPLLIQLLFIYFVIAPVYGFGPLFSAVLALSLFEGAYIAEIIRGGILSVARGQWEAGAALGLSTGQRYRYIVLPQALRSMAPPLAGQIISLIKDSALVSVIAVYDLTMQAQAIIAETFQVFEIWFTVACIYLSITMTFSFFVRRLENMAKMTV